MTDVRLTPRQKQIARLLSEEGLSRKEIAHALGIGDRTVAQHLYGHNDSPGLFALIGARGMHDVIRWYWRDGGRELCKEDA